MNKVKQLIQKAERERDGASRIGMLDQVKQEIDLEIKKVGKRL